MSKINSEIKKMKYLASELGFSANKLSDEYLFTLVGVNHFLYNNNLGPQDIQDGYVDGKNDGGIDFIFTGEDTLYLVQGKSQYEMSDDELWELFNKMDRTVKKFEKEDYSNFNEQLRSQYLNLYDSFNVEPKISLILFTNAQLNNKQKDKFYKSLEYSNLRDYTIHLYDHESIKVKTLESDMAPDYISEDSVKLDAAKKYLYYKENGMIVNISAFSLKRLFDKHKNQGLFSYNLREYFTQKTVDTGIDKTIQEEPENFWYYNNGVTFVCDDFSVDGYILKLKNFSIINGAQTTTKIGSSRINAKNDFHLVAKIIRSPKGNINENKNFIGKISEASNSQKPIRPRDLKANRREQKLLQKEAEKHSKPLAIRIKRGLKPDNFNKVEKWQRVENEYIGQLILSVILQRPGTARSGKKGMFDNDKIYNQVFKRKMDYDTLYDLVKLGDYFNNFKQDFLKNNIDRDKEAVVKNGKHIILALTGYLIKRNRELIDDRTDQNLKDDNINKTLITQYKGDDLEERIKDVFKFLVSQLKLIYNNNKNNLGMTSVSNFFKTDKNYHEIILSDFEEEVFNDDYNLDRIKKYYQIFDE